jgi:hypothetical protein
MKFISWASHLGYFIDAAKVIARFSEDINGNKVRTNGLPASPKICPTVIRVIEPFRKEALRDNEGIRSEPGLSVTSFLSRVDNFT